MKIQINQKFKDALFALEPEHLAELETSLLKNGLEVPIMTWRGFIIDGHNRWSIIQKHDLEFRTTNRDDDFETEEDVLEWIDNNQIGRRNLNANQLTIIIDRAYQRRKKKVGAQEGNKNAAKTNGVKITPLNSDEEVSELIYDFADDYKQTANTTAEKTAKDYGVSKSKVHKSVKVATAFKKLPEPEQKEFLAGNLTQKDVLEKSIEVEKTIAISDDVIAMAQHHSEKLYRKLRELTSAINAAENSFKAKGLNLSDFAPRITNSKRKSLEMQAKKLASIGRCDCGAVCPKCNHGYLIK